MGYEMHQSCPSTESVSAESPSHHRCCFPDDNTIRQICCINDFLERLGKIEDKEILLLDCYARYEGDDMPLDYEMDVLREKMEVLKKSMEETRDYVLHNSMLDFSTTMENTIQRFQKVSPCLRLINRQLNALLRFLNAHEKYMSGENMDDPVKARIKVIKLKMRARNALRLQVSEVHYAMESPEQ